MVYSYSIDIEGKKVFFEFGKLATQATSSVVCRSGDTHVLATLCIGGEVTDFPVGEEFAPLTCEYRERSSSAGKIPGGFFKREGKPTDNEILVSRLIDRPIRPLIPKGYFYDTQIISLVISVCKDVPADMLAMNASALAFLLSPISKKQPLAAVRVSKIGSNFVINPSVDEIKSSVLNIVIAGTKSGIVMLEGESKEVSEEDMICAVELGYKNILKIIDLQEKILSDVQKPLDNSIKLVELDTKLYETVKSRYFTSLKEAFVVSKKKERNEALDQIRKNIIEDVVKENPQQDMMQLSLTIQKLEREIFEQMVQKDKRFDGRGLDELREVKCEVGLLPRTHGSALFIRGETQALATVTLGTKFDQQILDSLYEEEAERFMFHYNFLPFSVGEVKPLRAPSRREIGHGTLARKSLESIIPDESVFPHTIRIVSDILSSNGSTSMASVCAGSLALMDAGVPIKKHIAGVALGLITVNDAPYILTDIIGAEDRYGEMDFKVSGSRDGITAIQLDVKNSGLEINLLKEAFAKSKKARLQIIDIMEKCISKPRSTISEYAPRIKKIPIPSDKVGLLIGPGGKTIRQIQERTGSKLELDPEKNELLISSPDEKCIMDALNAVNNLIEDLEEGKIYKVKVKFIKEFGAIVETLSGKEGMIHISEITNGFVRRIEEYLSVGQVVDAILIGLDESGRGRFSIKQLSSRRESGR